MIGLGALIFGALFVAAILEIFSNNLQRLFFGLDRQ